MADFGEEQPVRRLSVENHEIYTGNTLDRFEVSEPFPFAGL